MKNTIRSAALLISLGIGQQAFAGVPVIDGVSNGMRIAEFAQTVAQWAKEIAEMKAQYDQLVTQTQQMEQTYNSMNGGRSWGSANRNDYGYINGDWADVLNNTDYSAVLDATRVVGADEMPFASESEAAQAIMNSQNQVAFNRTINEQSFNKINQRLNSLENLMNQVNSATDAKDIEDLQARIQSEQILLQNEQNRMQMMLALQQNQRDIYEQQAH